MKFGIINPFNQTFGIGEFDTLHAAERAACLDPGEVDHGSFWRGLGYVVFQYGMFAPVDQMAYFSVGTTLVAGQCVLYAYEEAGETIDFVATKQVDEVLRFYASAEEIEAAILTTRLRRPCIAVNGDAIWQWPQPAPQGMGGKR